MPPDPLQNLYQNLQSSHKVYARLVEVAEGKQRHILANDIEALRADLREEEQLAAEGAQLGGMREGLHTQCRSALGLREGARTLGDLCARMPRGWKARFEKERDDLKRTIESLSRVNRLNVALVNNSLEMMQGLLAALFDAEPVGAYGPGGERSQPELVHGSLNAQA